MSRVEPLLKQARPAGTGRQSVTGRNAVADQQDHRRRALP
jgi:hypothetical protein